MQVDLYYSRYKYSRVVFLPVGTFDTGTHSVGKQYRQNEANAVGFFMLNNNTQSPSFF